MASLLRGAASAACTPRVDARGGKMLLNWRDAGGARSGGLLSPRVRRITCLAWPRTNSGLNRDRERRGSRAHDRRSRAISRAILPFQRERGRGQFLAEGLPQIDVGASIVWANPPGLRAHSSAAILAISAPFLGPGIRGMVMNGRAQAWEAQQRASAERAEAIW